MIMANKKQNPNARKKKCDSTVDCQCWHCCRFWARIRRASIPTELLKSKYQLKVNANDP
jgi:hypothetical protein